MHYILFEHLSLTLSWTLPVQCETVQPGSRAAGEVREMTTWVTWVSLMVTIPDTDLGEMIQMILPQCLQLVHTHSLHQWWTRENQLWKYRNDLYWEFERICLNLCRVVYIAFKVESWMIDPPWTVSSLDNDDLRCWIQLKYVNISATSSMVLSPAVSILHSDRVHLITCPEIYLLNWMKF